MTTQELEGLIEGQTENQNLDFKQNCKWDVKKMAKDLIAMSNLRDGGYIVIGVREEGLNFVAEGVIEDNINSYKIDIIRDQMLRYADPNVDVRVSYPVDSNGKKYVVIRVFPFKEIPVFSKIDIPNELKANLIYYRNSNRRIESAAVSNSNDLRDIIELAAVRLMQRRKAFGFQVQSEESEILDKQIQDISETELLTKIKSRGYWKIRFQPLQLTNLEKLETCKDVVESSQVKLNWNFPWIPRRNDENKRLHPSDNCYEAESELGSRKEFWRMYQSEQFIMYNALTEDWYEEDNFRSDLVNKYPPGKSVMYFTSIIHLITQSISFAERLAKNSLYLEGVRITMVLNRTKGRQLELNQSGRINFIQPKVTMASNIKLERELLSEQLVSDSVSISNRFILKTLEYFGFNPPADQILRDQIEFLKGN